MTTEKNNGGSVFPGPMEAGITLRDYCMINAPAAEIESLIPVEPDEIEIFIGIKKDSYVWLKHYVLALVKARGIWADAIIAERSK